MTTATETRTRTLTETIELVTYKGGSTEVYAIDTDGLSMFAGYYEDVSTTALAAKVHPLLAGHQAAHRNFWSTYLPGAQTWLRAA